MTYRTALGCNAAAVIAAAVAAVSVPAPASAAARWGPEAGAQPAWPPSGADSPSSSSLPHPPLLDRQRRTRWNKDTSSWVGSTFSYADEGGVYAWGDAAAGGSTTSPVNIKKSLAYGVAVERVFVNKVAFAALVEGGGVITWGDAAGGGDSSAVAADLAKGVHTIFATDRAFAARKSDGSLVVWGDAAYGGANPGTIDAGVVAGQVKDVTCTSRAFAALTRDGTVHVWGAAEYGGTYNGSEALINIQTVHANDHAFVAITAGNGAIAWGDTAKGGYFPESIAGKMVDRVARIWSTEQAFVALRYGTTTTSTITHTTTTKTATTSTTTTSISTTTTTTVTTQTATTTTTTVTTITTSTATTTTVTTKTATTTTATTTTDTTRTTTTKSTTTTTYTSTTTRTTVTRTTTVTTVTTTTRTATTTTTTHICSAVFAQGIPAVAHCCLNEATIAPNGAECTSVDPDNVCSLAVLPSNALTGAEIASCDGIRPYCYAPFGSPCNDTNTGIVGECSIGGQCAELDPERSNENVWKVAGPIIGVIAFIGLIVVVVVIHRKCATTGGSSKVSPQKQQKPSSGMSATQINGGMGGSSAGGDSASDGAESVDVVTGNGFLNKLRNADQSEILVMDDNGVVFQDGADKSNFKTVVRHLIHLNGVSSGQATKLRRSSIHDAEKALKAAFTDFTRHEVARIRAQLSSSTTLDAKLRDRLQRKLKLVEQELDAAEEKVAIEADGGDFLKTHNIMAQLFKEQTKAQLQHQRQLTEQRSATAAMLRTRLTAKLTGIEGELRAQSAADGVIMSALSKLEQNMVELRSLLSIIPNSADKQGLQTYNTNKYRLINAVMIWTQKVELLCEQYGDGTELSKKAVVQCARMSEESTAELLPPLTTGGARASAADAADAAAPETANA